MIELQNSFDSYFKEFPNESELPKQYINMRTQILRIRLQEECPNYNDDFNKKINILVNKALEYQSIINQMIPHAFINQAFKRILSEKINTWSLN